MDIVIIGSGNVADGLGRKIMDAGHHLVEIASRNRQRGKELSDQFGIPFQPHISEVSRAADLYIVAISDDALPGLHKQLRLGRAVVAHTAGSVSKDVLREVSANYGVLYPLQAFRAGRDVPKFPMLVDGNTPETLTLLEDFAMGLAEKVIHAGDEQRKKLHLAAVISGNFTNHLLALVQDFCMREDMDFQLLVPYMEQVFRSLEDGKLRDLQTGPAIRNDVETLEKHLEMLEADPILGSLYRNMTSSIQSYHRIQPKAI